MQELQIDWVLVGLRTMSVEAIARSERYDCAGLSDRGPAKPSIFVLSDVRLYREGLSWSLVRDGSLDVLGAAEPSAATFQSLQALAPDLVILDIGMRNSLELARGLSGRLPKTKLIALAVSDIDDEIVVGAMAGISGYVHRDGSIADLVAAALNAMRGELHCSPRTAACLLQHIASLSVHSGKSGKESDADKGSRALTRRESEILGLVDKGLSNKEIARALNISFATVKNHVHHILDKLQVRRRTQALARIRRGYVKGAGCSPTPFTPCR